MSPELTVPRPVRGELRHHESMAAHTSWRVGGPADRFFRPADVDDLSAFLAGLPLSEPVFWLGLGSNLLVRDGGIRGTVIATHGVLVTLERAGARAVRCGVGVPCAKVARFCAQAGLAGAEFLAGIPGTMGGALAMNAGAFGGETWDIVAAVETIDRRGRIHRRTPDEFQIGYRSVRWPGQERFLEARLGLSAGDPGVALERIRELLARRSASQPTGVASCGSVFRNPPNDYAARLIEAAGLKGYCFGKACISDKHANFIINTGGAQAADIEALIGHVQHSVEERYGVRLVPEVQIIGEAR
jgi:UDP-N-acetylmuramate dehydrogenase